MYDDKNQKLMTSPTGVSEDKATALTNQLPDVTVMSLPNLAKKQTIAVSSKETDLTLFLPADGWDKFSHPYSKKDFGKWELTVPPKHDTSPAVDHNSKLKVAAKTSSYLFSLA